MYYLVHCVMGYGELTSDNQRVIDKIFKDGYLYCSKYTKIESRSHNPHDYVYLSLLNKYLICKYGINLVFSDKLLLHRTFRYNYNWHGFIYDETVRVKTKNKEIIMKHLNNLEKFIIKNAEENVKAQKANQAVIKSNNGALRVPFDFCSHEIFIKKKINLHKYLIAVTIHGDKFTKTIKYITKHYPHVKILKEVPDTSTELFLKLSTTDV